MRRWTNGSEEGHGHGHGVLMLVVGWWWWWKEEGRKNAESMLCLHFQAQLVNTKYHRS